MKLTDNQAANPQMADADEYDKIKGRSKALLESMLVAMETGDERTYFDCFDMLQNVTLELLNNR